MGQMLSNILRLSRPGTLVFHCPGCNSKHFVYFNESSGYPDVWQWNGDAQKPTFWPSLNVNYDHPEIRCHSGVTGGMITFFSDSWHDLKNKTVPLPDFYPPHQTDK